MHVQQLIRRLQEGVSTRLGPGGIRLGFVLGLHRQRVADPGIESYRWLWVLAGRVRCRDEHGREHRLGPSDCFIRAPRQRHHVERDSRHPPLECFVLLPALQWSALSEIGLIDPAQRAGHLPSDAASLAALWDWYRVLEPTMPPLARADWLAGLHERLARLHRSTTGNDDLVDRACAILARDLDRPLQIAAVARHLGCNQEVLRLAFRRQLGCTPKAWRIRRRIEAAAALLRDPGRSITAIARELGYADAFSLSRQFKQVMGLSPQHYRAG